MGKTAVERLAEAIGYPERVPAGASSALLRVDGAEVHAEEADGRIVLRHLLTEDEALLPTLASYAVGRMLREDATLSWEGGAFLWQEAPSGADAHALLRLFETFMDSCDWWRARLDALRVDEGGRQPETMMIRP